MGKIIKDGSAFMEYVNSRLIRKIDDIPELKNELIALSESKTHVEMSKYALLLVMTDTLLDRHPKHTENRKREVCLQNGEGLRRGI